MVEEAEEPHRQREKRMLRVYRLNSRVEELKGAVKAAAAREDYAAAANLQTELQNALAEGA